MSLGGQDQSPPSLFLLCLLFSGQEEAKGQPPTASPVGPGACFRVEASPSWATALPPTEATVMGLGSKISSRRYSLSW